MAARWRDWLRQARADLAQAELSAAHGHHEWACFAAHQAAEKALKGHHFACGQQVWGHGLARSWRELPERQREALQRSVEDLEDCLRILDSFYIPTSYPDSLPEGAPADSFGTLHSRQALDHARAIVDAIGDAMA